MASRPPTIIAGIRMPDSVLASQATELLREHGSDLLFNHSLRAFLFASLKGRHTKKRFDPELLFVSAVFHDLGLTPHFRSPDKRFEVDGADAARGFLEGHGLSPQDLQLVWDAVALHTSSGIAEYKEPEVALLNYGVALDVVGKGYDQWTEKIRQEIISHFPRLNFKKRIIGTFFEGFQHKPETTQGNMNADICAFMMPHFHRKNFCEAILHAPWTE